jgi:hypothetical protein
MKQVRLSQGEVKRSELKKSEVEKNEIKKVVIAMVVIIVLIILAIAAFKIKSGQFTQVESYPVSYSRKDFTGPIELSGQDKVSVVVHTGQGNTDFYPVDYVASESAYKHLVRLDAENSNVEFQFSMVGDKQILVGINDKKFKLEDNQYWELLLNGDPVAVTLSDLYIKPGDVVEFRIADMNN